MRRYASAWTVTMFGLATALILASCAQEPAALEMIRNRGELRVVTVNAPTAYYLGAHGPDGLEYELAMALTNELGVNLVMYPVADIKSMQQELASGRADIAAAQITWDPSWKDIALPSEPYDQIGQLVVYPRGKKRPRSTLQIENSRLAVRGGSPQERILERMKKTVAPDLDWIATAPLNADPLEDIDSGQADYAVIDAREFSFSRHLYPNIRVGFTLPQQRAVQWMIGREETDLLHTVNRFIRKLKHSARLSRMIRESSGDLRDFQYEESREFRMNLQSRLRRYQPWFEQAGEESGIDWRLLAAIGYQESKWNPQAQSGDGAAGIMMLVSTTATAMGIEDRMDPKQSIFAGARYFAEVKDKLPERIQEPDRTLFALASYNMGFGHLEDARILAQSRGKNPDSWADVREQLPLLAQERWYTQAKHGYARGWEPVQFVDRVQRFLTLLEWQPN